MIAVRASVITDLITDIDHALQAGDMARFNASLDELIDVSPQDARDVMMILGRLR